MTLYVLIAGIFMITAFVTATLIIIIITSRNSGLYENARKERDALKKLSDASNNLDNELQEITDDELRKRALGRW